MLSAVLFGKWTDHVKSWRQAELGERIMYITYEEMVQVKLRKTAFSTFYSSTLSVCEYDFLVFTYLFTLATIDNWQTCYQTAVLKLIFYLDNDPRMQGVVYTGCDTLSCLCK